jgi:hypothetical protein
LFFFTTHWTWCCRHRRKICDGSNVTSTTAAFTCSVASAICFHMHPD